MRANRARFGLLSCALVVASCGDWAASGGPRDGGAPAADAGEPDDAGPGPTDAGPAGAADAGALDAGAPDAGAVDAGPPVNPYLAPEQRGPWPVGNRSYFLEDPARDLGCGEGKRVLLTEVWYPAADEARSLTEHRTPGFFLGREAEVQAAVGAGQAMNDLPTGSYRDAPVRAGARPFPILVFSHGMQSNRFQNFTLASHLASHGYVVVAPDHVCEAKVTLLPDRVVTGQLWTMLVSLEWRKGDVRFVANRFLTAPPAELAGKLDTAHLALLGHSWGGLTVSEVIKDLPAAGALVQLASFGYPPVPSGVAASSLFLWGKEEQVVSFFRTQHDQYIAQMPPPRYELELKDTGHFAFSDLCVLFPSFQNLQNGCGTNLRASLLGTYDNPDHAALHAVMNAWTTAFLGATFFQEPTLRAWLQTNHAPSLVDYRKAGQ